MTGAEIMTIVTLVGTAHQIHASQQARRQQKRANREAERISERNAVRIEEETQEKARRMRQRQDRAESSAIARAAASGVTMEGSPEDFLAFMGEEHARQLGWLKKSGKSRAELARLEGRYASLQGQADLASMDARAGASTVQGIGNSYMWGQRAGWWGN